ncbi:hypothetical protein EN804_25050 [Mesorhizobium sp. M8A.F.Ca.ET.161.01.1.1]|nr:hypothetical protein EN746_05015 [Mesorhizobium sp. M8A.F.Ca.ET.023.02.2.1]TGS37810.1 hypothetical protein EN825_30480 [Mesorhizobium sp. M8A.F.Ca.ET.182.01.1.1]TGS76725.1 hypothetical protein EN824_29835 [Mesorhizobium sp. M8A.F.Ca.ET.181.01.1.1]TGT36561.1 hypothetical protein EN808_27690 [Mesorhizobium sp. M8A.F.Ca.ET.165.01.1.1]TGT84709.1 hypothetical protein EN804_25050 [Mesorhizobium sp. M8A.F.Ca.ET.161.01.1.1]TGV38214.1 hypothetical protein EN785_25035 [Mesorhizobium sp. M8A.F.Ca.ET.1
MPAGILSPYSDGERGAVIADFANRRCRNMAPRCGGPLSPRTGRKPGRAMRGGTDLSNRRSPLRVVNWYWSDAPRG